MEEPITITLRIGPDIYKKLKTEALVYLMSHGGNSIDIVNAWGVIFQQIDKDVCAGKKEVSAKLGMKKYE